MRIPTLIVGSFAAITIFAIGSSTTHAQSQTVENKPAENIVKVEPGNTLSGIAKDNTTTYTRLFDANIEIENPDKIFPGQDIRIPAPEEELASRGLPVAPVAAATPKAQPKPVAKSAPRASTRPAQVAAPADASTNGGVWDQLAKCESGGNWSINTGNGYYGGLQFSLSSWKAVGGSGYPHQASKSEQIARAEALKARQGWGAWPSCTSKLGLR
jgi:LysM repeat protein